MAFAPMMPATRKIAKDDGQTHIKKIIAPITAAAPI